MPFQSYKQSMRSSFLQSRKLFFATVVIIHAIVTLIAAVDVSSDATRHSAPHLTAAVLNMATHLFSFISITLLALLDSIDQGSRWCVSQVRYEVVFVVIITCLQFANAVVYSVYSSRFQCALDDSTCWNVGRIILVASWILTILHIAYCAYFIAVAVFAAQRVKKVWVTPTKVFAWDPASLPISRPSAPLDILGYGANMIEVSRETWVNPQHDKGTASPKLPPVSIPPVPPLPRVEDLYPGQTYNGQKMRPLPSPPLSEKQGEPDFSQDASPFNFKTSITKSRPLTFTTEASRYSPPIPPLKTKGHSKGAFSQDAGMARYAHVTRETSIRGRGDWMTPGYTYGREYVERPLSPQPSLPVSPRAGLPSHRRQQPSITTFRPNQDGRYPHVF